MLETLNQLDHSLMLWMNYDGGTFLDNFWYALSNKYTWVPMYLAILAVVSLHARRTRQWRPLVLFILITALVIVLADQIASGLIKPLIERPRPSHQEGIMEQLHLVNDYRGGAYGFVSSHASNTLALALWLSLFFRNRALTCAMTCFTLLNCYSRIYLGVHYPGDILGGLLVGLIAGLTGYVLYRRLVRSKRLSPDSQSTTSEPPYSYNIPSPTPITLTFWASIVVMAVIALF